MQLYFLLLPVLILVVSQFTSAWYFFRVGVERQSRGPGKRPEKDTLTLGSLAKLFPPPTHEAIRVHQPSSSLFCSPIYNIIGIRPVAPLLLIVKGMVLREKQNFGKLMLCAFAGVTWQEKSFGDAPHLPVSPSALSLVAATTQSRMLNSQSFTLGWRQFVAASSSSSSSVLETNATRAPERESKARDSMLADANKTMVL